jgi:cold-inducible RNA-binding protein
MADVTNKVYVGNLDYGVDKNALEELFSEVGQVTDAVVITDRNTGRSKGFGFVEFGTEEAATKAVETFNGKDFQGREIKIDYAKPREPRR